MSSESRPMEVIKHNLDCQCHRRREWIRVNDKWRAIEFSVDDPNEPPMTEEEKSQRSLNYSTTLIEKIRITKDSIKTL